ncbi:MAG: hypothetical protein RR144_06300 [Clostridia bacterium]
MHYAKEQAEHRKKRLPYKNKESSLYTTEERLAVEAELKYKNYIKGIISFKIISVIVMLIVIILYFISSITLIVKSHIDDRKRVDGYSVAYYPIKGCRSKIKAYGDGTDGGIQSDYEQKFYKYCIKDPTVYCKFNDVVFHNPYVTCWKYYKLEVDPLALKIIEKYPFNKLIKIE